jgi:hypothetical protein
MRALLRRSARCDIVLAAASPPDAHGYFTLGTNAEYVSRLIGHVPFFLEVSERMARRFGLNRSKSRTSSGGARTIARSSRCRPRRLTIAMSRSRARFSNACRRGRRRGRHRRDPQRIDERAAQSARPRRPYRAPVRRHHGARRARGRHRHPQADPSAQGRDDLRARDTAPLRLASRKPRRGDAARRLWSSSGGQADFARGAMYSEGGAAFIVLHSTTTSGRSRIRVARCSCRVIVSRSNG